MALLQDIINLNSLFAIPRLPIELLAFGELEVTQRTVYIKMHSL